MTASQLVDSERQNATVWIARAAPRRWYASNATTNSEAATAASTALFRVSNAPSRWGTVGFEMGPQVNHVTAVNLTIEFKKADGQVVVRPPTLMVRVRDPDGRAVLASAAVKPGSDCEVVDVHGAREIVVVRPTAAAVAAMRVGSCVLNACFSPVV
jgi:hypothetical protein